jgi:hypothetical protein
MAPSPLQVAVLERINPQGLYSTRVARLGSFGAASLRVIPGQLADDIPDPLYYSTSRTAEAVALRAAVHRIAFACRGLVHCLAQLRARCAAGRGAGCSRCWPTWAGNKVISWGNARGKFGVWGLG